MPYIGQQPTSVAFLTDTFSGNGSTTAFTLSAAPANTSSVLVAVSGVLQDPSTYSVSGTTLTFSGAPPSGTSNISVRFLGIPASGVTTTAYRTVTEFTATAGQTSFSVPSYTVGFIDVYRNGVMLGSADYTATNGTTVVLASGATAGDLVEVISFQVSSVLNAIPASPASVQTSYLVDGSVTTAKIASAAVDLTTKVTGVLPQANGGTGTTTGYYGFKNRIINGAMMIDQRNAGSSITPTSGTYSLDRWNLLMSQASKYSCQQNAGSVTPPAGFTNYLGITSTSAYSVSSSDYFGIYQPIEGFNFADCNFGSSNASTITISFWVRSSLTGTFGGVFNNYAGSRAYPFTYTISAANTWERKTITIAGDTSGTWVGASNAGVAYLLFSLGAGSDRQGTASGSWATPSTAPFTATGATSVVGTNGATFYITGVQLEKGSTATSFDYRPYGTELSLCQRYFYSLTGAAYQIFGYGVYRTTTTASIFCKHPVQMRATPTLTNVNLSNMWIIPSNVNTVTGAAIDQADTFGAMVDVTGATSTVGFGARWIANNNTSAAAQFSSEL